jgi:hypothetical protein
MDGVAAVGVATKRAREDHVHPTDTSRAPLASPTLTGIPAAPTAAVNTNTTQIATTAFVLAQAASATPAMNGTAAVGTATKFAREDHVHASDTTRAPLASPTFTGVPAAPTASAGTNTTQIATTAFVTTADNLKANLASPTFTGTPAAPTATAGTNTTQIATTAFVSTAIVNKVDAGTTNADSDLLYALLVEVDTRSVNITRDALGKISQIDVKDGSTVVQSFAVTRNANGKMSTIVETAAGKTITYTIARDSTTGKPSTITKTVA